MAVLVATPHQAPVNAARDTLKALVQQQVQLPGGWQPIGTAPLLLQNISVKLHTFTDKFRFGPPRSVPTLGHELVHTVQQKTGSLRLDGPPLLN